MLHRPRYSWEEKMKRFFSAILALAVGVLFTGCGGSSSSGGGGGTTSIFVPGKWTFSLFPSSSGLFGPTFELDMNLTQSGGTISSTNENAVDNISCSGMHLDSSTGSASGDKITLVFSIDSEKITLNATLAPGGTAVGEAKLGNFSVSDGPCLGGQHGIFTADLAPSLTGTSIGTMTLGSITTEPMVTAMLAEDPNFNVSGSMAVTDDPCFSSLAIAPGNLGVALGRLFSFEMTDGTNVVDFVGQINESGPPIQSSGQVSVVSGCTEEGGEFSLTESADPGTGMQAPAANGAKAATPKINPLLIERMKALQIARRQNAQ
jgi:hypothetical protein